MWIEERLWAELLGCSRSACQSCDDQVKSNHIAEEGSNSLPAEATSRLTPKHWKSLASRSGQTQRFRAHVIASGNQVSLPRHKGTRLPWRPPLRRSDYGIRLCWPPVPMKAARVERSTGAPS